MKESVSKINPRFRLTQYAMSFEFISDKSNYDKVIERVTYVRICQNFSIV